MQLQVVMMSKRGKQGGEAPGLIRGQRCLGEQRAGCVGKGLAGSPASMASSPKNAASRIAPNRLAMTQSPSTESGGAGTSCRPSYTAPLFEVQNSPLSKPLNRKPAICPWPIAHSNEPNRMLKYSTQAIIDFSRLASFISKAR